MLISQATPVLRIGITGGIASGKSYVCARLAAAGHTIFYCDDVAKHIIRTDPAVKAVLKRVVGPSVYDAEGRLVKRVLAAWLCRGKAAAAQVDAIVHPRVAAAFREEVDAANRRVEEIGEPLPDLPREVTIETLAALPPRRVLFMECALLFESGFDRLVDRSVLVHVSAATQEERLMARDGIDRAAAREWIALQLSEDEKLRRADALLRND